ncbi:hypothetical protein [Pseudomonas sp. BMS12]|uniref:hypothetical protein n=1 Tax=Pseudomonas sp. BMS12 TaxID=1796033 RepID=UPI00083A3105|nr:hypothetical protein [Pseudomonas sp. BMS12]
MRRLAALLLCAGLLTGCAGSGGSPDGTWINQSIVEEARQGGPLREALLAYGPVLEWQFDSGRSLATYSNGFESPQGRLDIGDAGQLTVAYQGGFEEHLKLQDDQLIQLAGAQGPQQQFSRASHDVALGAPIGSSFEWVLYEAYLGGKWLIREGQGQGGLVLFHPDGSLEGLPGAERYALCLAGDCASMAGDNDSLWLQLGEQGAPWIFQREGEQLRILEAFNAAAPDEIPEYRPGRLTWLLQRD